MPSDGPIAKSDSAVIIVERLARLPHNVPAAAASRVRSSTESSWARVYGGFPRIKRPAGSESHVAGSQDVKSSRIRLTFAYRFAL